MSDISGCSTSSLRYMRPLLETWLSQQKRGLGILDSNDAPWWYNERASLSILAGAIWLRGGYVIEEHVTTKVSSKESKSGPSHVGGRGDLYFYFGRSHFVVEAKHYWPILGVGRTESTCATLEG